MPGNPASFLNTGSSALTGLLNTPIPGVDSPGFDALSTGYDTAYDSGLGDLAGRGLIDTGATPSMVRQLQQQFNTGAGQVVAQGAQEQNQQRLAILNAMLGLGNAGLNVSRAGIGSEFEDIGDAGDVLSGLFGLPNSAIKSSGGGGILSQGVGNLLSQLGF
jgi:hypothetical protein